MSVYVCVACVTEACVNVVQTHLVPGEGRLIVTPLAGVGAKEALRVAYTLAMLLEKRKCLFPAGRRGSRT
jgi:hypothetical protein